jgi:hypothetical protein
VVLGQPLNRLDLDGPAVGFGEPGSGRTRVKYVHRSKQGTGGEAIDLPLLLGSGKRLFAEGTVPTALRLVESATFSKGAVHLIYERAGKPTFGSIA